MKNIVYDCRWSNNVNPTFIRDYNIVKMAVFGGKNDEESFIRFFNENIYGPSVVVVVYIDDVPSAARALWRNDIDGKPAYQPCGTCVLETCRGLGIFSEMTKRSVALLKETDIIYNFPNRNSYPGYIKMGWQLQCSYIYWNVLISLGNYKKIHPIDMDYDYAKWWPLYKKTYYYTSYRGSYFLVRQHPTKPLLYILSKVDEKTAKLFPKSKRGILLYQSPQRSLICKRKGAFNVVNKNGQATYIPTWKWDAI